MKYIELMQLKSEIWVFKSKLNDDLEIVNTFTEVLFQIKKMLDPNNSEYQEYNNRYQLFKALGGTDIIVNGI